MTGCVESRLHALWAVGLLWAACFSPTVAAQTWFETGQDADLALSSFGLDNSGGPLVFNHPGAVASDGAE